VIVIVVVLPHLNVHGRSFVECGGRSGTSDNETDPGRSMRNSGESPGKTVASPGRDSCILDDGRDFDACGETFPAAFGRSIMARGFEVDVIDRERLTVPFVDTGRSVPVVTMCVNRGTIFGLDDDSVNIEWRWFGAVATGRDNDKGCESDGVHEETGGPAKRERHDHERLIRDHTGGWLDLQCQPRSDKVWMRAMPDEKTHAGRPSGETAENAIPRPRFPLNHAWMLGFHTDFEIVAGREWDFDAFEIDQGEPKRCVFTTCQRNASFPVFVADSVCETRRVCDVPRVNDDISDLDM